MCVDVCRRIKKTCFSMFALITLLINTQKCKKMCHCLAAYWETRMLDFFVVPSVKICVRKCLSRKFSAKIMRSKTFAAEIFGRKSPQISSKTFAAENFGRKIRLKTFEARTFGQQMHSQTFAAGNLGRKSRHFRFANICSAIFRWKSRNLWVANICSAKFRSKSAFANVCRANFRPK